MKASYTAKTETPQGRAFGFPRQGSAIMEGSVGLAWNEAGAENTGLIMAKANIDEAPVPDSG